MIRDPYAVRRDFTWAKRIAIGVGLALVLGLLGFYFLRPTSSPADQRASDELSAQMDASEKQSDERRATAERDRQEQL